MKVFILGGDGFCGWPTSLHLSNLGHEVVIVDNLSRRNIDNELGATSLTPIATIDKRIAAWKEVSSRELGFYNLNLATEYERFFRYFGDRTTPRHRSLRRTTRRAVLDEVAAA